MKTITLFRVWGFGLRELKGGYAEAYRASVLLRAISEVRANERYTAEGTSSVGLRIYRA